MRWNLPFFALLVTAVLIMSGCRIQLVTNEGGSVVATSGIYECNPGSSCPSINVRNTSFDETFVASPQAGYRFTGWRRRDRGFCGGSLDACSLSTEGFAGNQALLDFLSGNETFFLEAQFELDEQPSNLAPSEGLWVGTTDRNQAVQGLVLSDGTYYVIYSAQGVPSLVGGVIQGSSSTNGSTFTSNNARDFNLEGAGILGARVSAQVNPQQVFNGTVSYDNGLRVGFTTTYDSDYQIRPSREILAGSYDGDVAFSLGVESAELTFSDNGSVSGIGVSGCTLSGNYAPRQTGNVYDVTIRFGGFPCVSANQSYTGIVYLDARTGDLIAAVTNSNRSDGFLFIGD